MQKIFKKAVSLFVLVVFILSLVPAASFASTEPYTFEGVNDGSATIYSKIDTGVHMVQAVEKNGLGGKDSDDSYLKVSFGYGSSTYIDFLRYKDVSGAQDVAEFSVYIPSDGCGFTANIRITDKVTGNERYPLQFTKDGIYYAGSSTQLLYGWEPNKWYNVAIETPAPFTGEVDSEGNSLDSKKLNIYVNGSLVVPIDTFYTDIGYDQFRLISPSTNADTINAYLDNIRVYSGTYNPQYDVADNISYTGDIDADNNIFINGDTTVGELKANITKKTDTSIRVYQSLTSTTPLSDSAYLDDGYVVVVSAKNGSNMDRTYSYYKIVKSMYTFKDIYDGSQALSGKTNSQIIEKNSLGGKASDDEYIKASIFEGGRIDLDLSNASGNQDVLEFSVYIPDNGLGFQAGLRFTNTDSGNSSLPLNIKKDGIFYAHSSGDKLIYSWEPNKWYNVAFETPRPYTGEKDSKGNSLDTNSMKIYVNGELVSEYGACYTNIGYNRIRLTGSATADQVSAYLDNVRLYSGTYRPRYDVVDNVSHTDGTDANGNLIVKGNKTVSEYKLGFTKNEDTTISLYESLTSSTPLADGEYVEDGNIVVAAARNGSNLDRTYSYYTVKKVNKSIDVNTFVNGQTGRLYDDDDDISVSTSYTNHDTIAHNVVMYTALYKQNELINIWEDSKTVGVDESKTFTCDFAGKETNAGTKVKIMLWDSTDLTPLSQVSTMRYSSANTQTTLYLLGDSIVQTYVDPPYPIQGWGYYIGDYLNDNIRVENRATSGWTTDHYLYPDGIYTRTDGVTPYGTELRKLGTNALKEVPESERYKIWSNILTELKEGDYVMIALGTNDSNTGNVPKERYLENITTIYNDATAKGATVILSTPTINGQQWGTTIGFYEDKDAKEYGQICTDFAKDKGLVCLPVGAELVKIYTQMTNDYMAQNPNDSKITAMNYTRGYFHLYNEVINTPVEDGGFGYTDYTGEDDSTHYNYRGSNKLTQVIVELLKQTDSTLGDYIIE